MVHYTCDQCGRDIDPENELRFVVKLEVCAALVSAEAAGAEDDRDHLLELHQSFEKVRSDLDVRGEDLTPRELRFDLCCDCHKKFARNPLGRDVGASLNFSQN